MWWCNWGGKKIVVKEKLWWKKNCGGGVIVVKEKWCWNIFAWIFKTKYHFESLSVSLSGIERLKYF